MTPNADTKNVFTTHEVSKLLQVNPRSVINWIEQDLLSSYRTPGGHRRIRRDDLLAFLRKHEIPVPPSLTAEKFKILIVEDEDDIVKILTTSFGRQSVYEVTSASDGITALIDIGRLHPDLMVLDILIPGVDGLEVCRRIKENPVNRTAIIAMSGQPEVESKILQAGADCFLPKPLDLDRLWKRPGGSCGFSEARQDRRSFPGQAARSGIPYTKRSRHLRLPKRGRT